MSRKWFSPLGLVASSKRKILDGVAYEKLFPTTLSTDPIINDSGSVHDTVEYCRRIVLSTLGDTKKITKVLLARANGNLDAFCKAVFEYAYKHYQYTEDKKGVEQLRRPARAFKDRKKGIDCDCFSITVSSILTNANVPHYFRIVKMYSREYFQHIYVVVPKRKGANMDDKNQYYAIDPVLDKYNYEAPDITFKKDREMSNLGMPIQYLNGTEGSARLGDEFNGLGDTNHDLDGAGFYREYLKRKRMHLVNTRNAIARNPKHFSRIYRPHALKGAYDELLGAFDQGEAAYEAKLEHLSGIEESFIHENLQGLGDIIHGPDDELFGLINEDFQGINGLDGKRRKARRAAGGKKRKTGVFTKIKNFHKKVKNDVKSLKSKEGRKAAFKKLKKAFLKTNPGLIPIRAGFLAGLKTNFGRIASNLYWGYFTLDEAKKAGVSPDFHARAVNAVAKVSSFYEDKLGGEPSAMRKAIITGRAAKKSKQLARKGKLNGIDELLGVSGLGEGASVAIAAGVAALTAVAGIVKSLMKNKNGKQVTEDGGEEDASGNFQDTDPGPKSIKNDYSTSTYNREVNQSGGSESGGGSSNTNESSDGDGGSPSYPDEEADRGHQSRAMVKTNNPDQSNDGGGDPVSTDTLKAGQGKGVVKAGEGRDTDGGGDPVDKPEESKSSTGMMVALAAAVGLAAIGMNASKKKKEEVKSDLHGPAKTNKKKLNQLKLK